MADNTRRNWYIAFGAILTAIGTFLVTTDPIFHYADLFKNDELDTTKVVKNMSQEDIDSLAQSIEPRPNLRMLSRKVQWHDFVIDSLKKEVKEIKGE